jgi:CheY-like chemotaxis protein
LTFGRGQSPRPRLVSLTALLGSLGSMLRRLLGEDVRLVTDLDPAVGTVFADPGQLEQVVINLAVNARDAMPAGGTLTVATRSVELTASWSRPDVRPGRYVLLSVADNGCGMTDEVRAHLFEPFFSTKGTGEGTGLGLAIVYGVVRQAGGHIDVRSAPGEGSLFEVYLPLAEAEGTGPEPGVAPPGALAGTESVLVAEDDGVIRGLVGRALKAAGYTVLEAADGDEALRVASAHADRIDLLVTDVVMPRLGGRDLAGLLLGTRPGLRVLFLSGYPDAVLVRRGALAAGSDFLEKPFTPEALARKVREVLDR